MLWNYTEDAVPSKKVKLLAINIHMNHYLQYTEVDYFIIYYRYMFPVQEFLKPYLYRISSNL